MTKHIEQYSTEELVVELLERESELVKSDGLLSPSSYKLRNILGTITCVDGIPCRVTQDSGKPKRIEILCITRNTGPEKGKFGMIGGVVAKGEQLEQALRRHFRADLGCEIDLLHNGDPIGVGEYRNPSINEPSGNFLPDPTKSHAVAIVYLVQIRDDRDFHHGETAHGGQEVRETHWFSCDNLPPIERFAYSQGLMFKKCLERMKAFQDVTSR